MKDIIKEFEDKMSGLTEYRKDSDEVVSGFYSNIVEKAVKRVLRDLITLYNDMGYASLEDAWKEFRDDALSNTMEPIHRDMKKYSWYNPNEAERMVSSAIDDRFNAGKEEVSEDRSTNAFGFISQLKSHPMVDKIVDISSRIDGYTALIRTKDGNAYEIDIRPASVSKNHPELTGKKG